MKKISRFLIVTFLIMMTFSAFHLLHADPPGPPPLPGGHGYEGNVPAGAPIDGGLSILAGLGLAWGIKVILKGKRINEQ